MSDREPDPQWNADVDRLLEKLPTYERAQPTPPRGADRGLARTVPTPGAGGGGAVTWVRAGLGLVLAAGMTVWPYSHVCGIKLFLYMGGIVTLVVTGVWAALAAWQYHRAFAHVVSLTALLCGLALGAGVVLPRVGYTGTEALWFCPEPAPSGPSVPPAPAAPSPAPAEGGASTI